jgi:hypothetical protein
MSVWLKSSRCLGFGVGCSSTVANQPLRVRLPHVEETTSALGSQLARRCARS